MPLLEEVDEGSEAGTISVEKMKSEHRRKRSKSRKRNKKTKADVRNADAVTTLSTPLYFTSRYKYPLTQLSVIPPLYSRFFQWYARPFDTTPFQMPGTKRLN